MDADGCFVHYYQALLDAEPSAVYVAPGQAQVFQVRVTNHSAAAWASRGPHPVAIGFHVERLDVDGPRMVAFDNPRTSIDSFVAPMDSHVFGYPSSSRSLVPIASSSTLCTSCARGSRTVVAGRRW